MEVPRPDDLEDKGGEAREEKRREDKDPHRVELDCFPCLSRPCRCCLLRALHDEHQQAEEDIEGSRDEGGLSESDHGHQYEAAYEGAQCRAEGVEEVDEGDVLAELACLERIKVCRNREYRADNRCREYEYEEREEELQKVRYNRRLDAVEHGEDEVNDLEEVADEEAVGSEDDKENAQRPVLVLYPPYPLAAEIAAQSYAREEDREGGRHRQGRGAEYRHYVPGPYYLVDKGEEVYGENRNKHNCGAFSIHGLLDANSLRLGLMFFIHFLDQCCCICSCCWAARCFFFLKEKTFLAVLNSR